MTEFLWLPKGDRGDKGDKGGRGLRGLRGLKLPIAPIAPITPLTNICKPHNKKNAKCGGNFVPNKKASPQFAYRK